jgi:signal transduction histidine kinase/DNA-binding NarL/FixJ family response regulator
MQFPFSKIFQAHSLFLILVGGLLPVIYITSLLVYNYQDNAALQESSIKRYKLDIEKQAETIGYFFLERKYDLRAMADSLEVGTYFATRAMGMSEQYGLKVSLFTIRQMMRDTIKNKTIDNDAIYKQFILVNHNKKILVNSTSSVPVKVALPWKEKLDNIRNEPELILEETGHGYKILLATPCFFKKKLSGWIITWLNLQVLHKHFMGSSLDVSSKLFILTLKNGMIIHMSNISNPNLPWENFQKKISKIKDLEMIPVTESPAGTGHYLVTRIQIHSLPLFLTAYVEQDEILGNLRAWQFLAGAGALIFLFFLGLLLFINTNTKNLILRARIDEAKKQQDLLTITNNRLEEAISRTKKMAEKAKAANLAKSVFLSNMSHELRTPLNAILGYTQFLNRDPSLTLKQQSGIKTIHQAGEHLLMLINDILDFSKIEAGKMELVKTEFRLPEFLQGIVDIIRVRARTKALDFFYEPEASLPAVIEADELRLRQVLLNLLSNAVKFTSSGYCRLRIQSRPVAAGNALLTIAIEDSGAGIIQEMQEEVFNPFQQTGEVLKYSEGSGLGLSISRKLLHLMDGELQLVSPINMDPEAGEGPGSRFSFTIEVPVLNDGAMGNNAGTAPEEHKVTGYTVPGKKGDPKKILIVDDNAPNRDVLCDTLESIGFVTEEAEDGSEVLAACAYFQPDAILMDLRMPGTDGFTATKQIRQHANFSHVPVIAVTASTGDTKKLKQRCLEHGFNGYFTKPYITTKLLEAIADQLQIELQYDEDTTGDPNQPEILPPPQDVLDNLVKLAQSGNIDAVSKQSGEIAMLEFGKYKAFAHQIKQLADDFQLIEIVKFITLCRKS